MSKIAIILVLPIEYNTSSMLRCKSIIAALCELGHTVTCFCPDPDVNSKYYSNRNLDISGITVVRFGKNRVSTIKQCEQKAEKKSVKSLLIKLALFFFRKIDVFGSALLYLPDRKIISRDISAGEYDILLSFSDPIPAHMIAKYCKKMHPGIMYIQQWGDPLASDKISKISQPVWLKKLIENSLLKSADRICYVSPFTCEEQKILFPKLAFKMLFLPTPSLSYEDGMVDNRRLSIGYFGSYYSVARDLAPFYLVAKKHPEADFYIIGDSDIVFDSTENVTIINRISLDELNIYMKKINVIVCLMNKKGNQVPGKVYHDASLKKDILFIKDGEYGNQIQNFFDRYEHYTFVDNTEESIEAAIKNYVSNGVPVRKPVKDFLATNIAKKLIE